MKDTVSIKSLIEELRKWFDLYCVLDGDESPHHELDEIIEKFESHGYDLGKEPDSCEWVKDFEAIFGVVAKADCTNKSEPIRSSWEYCPYCGKPIKIKGE